MPYMLGRRPPKNAPALQLANLLTGAVPVHPAADDNLSALGGWDMLGNDQHGDCVAVTWANVRRLVTHRLTIESYPTLDLVLAFYKTQNPGFPGEDNGMDVQTALEHLVSVGGPDGVKAVAFAKVDHTNESEVAAAIAIFGYVWTGVVVDANNQEEFAAGVPWTYDPAAQTDGGHSVIVGGYGPNWDFITWAAETKMAEDFWSHQVEECWVVIWPEHLTHGAFLAGIDQAQLAADYHAVTGKTLPVPPAPAPAPPGPVVVTLHNPSILAKIADYAEKRALTVEAAVEKILGRFWGI